jgi:hypothetical protein
LQAAVLCGTPISPTQNQKVGSYVATCPPAAPLMASPNQCWLVLTCWPVLGW